MRLGIVTPVVNLNPRFSPPEWESNGGIEEIVAVSKAAEAFGYEWVSCSEHVAIPTEIAAVRGGRYWDPAVTLSYVAAATRSIGLLPYVLVLGYHHPLEIVKRFGSLDEASGGRVILGVGVGSLREEFELLGAPFEGRGTLADEHLAAIRAAFGVRQPSFSGSHVSFSDFVVEPCGVARRVTIWVGGRTRRSLRRALELGDGWIPFGLGLEDLRAVLQEPQIAEAVKARGEVFDVVLAPEPPLDPMGDPAGVTEVLKSYAALGATGLSLRFRHRSLTEYLEQAEALKELAEHLT